MIGAFEVGKEQSLLNHFFYFYFLERNALGKRKKLMVRMAQPYLIISWNVFFHGQDIMKMSPGLINSFSEVPSQLLFWRLSPYFTKSSFREVAFDYIGSILGMERKGQVVPWCTALFKVCSTFSSFCEFFPPSKCHCNHPTSFFLSFFPPRKPVWCCKWEGEEDGECKTLSIFYRSCYGAQQRKRCDELGFAQFGIW